MLDPDEVLASALRPAGLDGEFHILHRVAQDRVAAVRVADEGIVQGSALPLEVQHALDELDVLSAERIEVLLSVRVPEGALARRERGAQLLE